MLDDAYMGLDVYIGPGPSFGTVPLSHLLGFPCIHTGILNSGAFMSMPVRRLIRGSIRGLFIRGLSIMGFNKTK